MASDTFYSGDEIDIRGLIQTLFHYKWLILGISLAAAVVVFVFSNFLQPRIYSAQAQVIITKPLYTTNLESRIQNVPQVPEAAVLNNLALAEDLLWDVYTSPAVTAVLQEGLGFEDFMAKMSTKLTGTTNLFLIVTDENAETSAIIVNVWADKFTMLINTLYSVNEEAKSKLEIETERARQKWDAAEQTLIDNLKGANVDAKKIITDDKRRRLTLYLNTVTDLDLLLSDAQSLQNRLAVWPDHTQLNIELKLSLIGLYQQAVGGLGGVQIQMSEPTTTSVKTVADAKVSLGALNDSIKTQMGELQDQQYQLEQDITTAMLAQEAADYQLTQLTTERDLALKAYEALSAQLEETQIDLARDDLVARVASQALPPKEAKAHQTLVKTMLAGILAFAIVSFCILLINWWKTSAPNNSNNSKETLREN